MVVAHDVSECSGALQGFQQEVEAPFLDLSLDIPAKFQPKVRILRVGDLVPEIVLNIMFNVY